MKQSKKLLLISGIFFVFSLVYCPFSSFGQTPFDMLQKSSSGEKESGPVGVVADNLEYLKSEKKIIAKGNVVVTYRETKLTSDYAEIYTDSKKAYAEGHVIIDQQGGLLRGEKVFYNFKTHQGSFPNGTAVQAPWYGFADQMDQVSQNKVQFYNAHLTTCPLDAGDPHYTMTAKRAILYPGERFIAYDVKFKILGQTVFWLPYLDIPLDWLQDPPIGMQVGRTKQWGWYILSWKTFALTNNITVKPHVGWYDKRGTSLGVDGKYHYDNLRTKGYFQTFYINDKNAPSNTYQEPNTSQDNPYAQRSDRERYGISYRHRTDFDDYSNLMVQFHKFSDEFVMQDFRERDFRTDMQPPTYAVLTRNTERTGLFVNTDVRTNNFFDETQQLPQARFDWNNQRLGNSGIFYQNQLNLANFDQRLSKYSDVPDKKNKSWRFDMPHRFSMPKKIGPVQILPAAGFRETWYSNTPSSKERWDIRQPGGDGEKNRFNLEAGIDFKTQASKVYDVSGNVLGMEFNKIRHLIEPTVGVHDVESLGPRVNELYQFDQVDQMGRKRTVVLGTENRIQTKRQYKSDKPGEGMTWRRVDVVSLNTYAFLNANTDAPNIEHTTGFTNLGNDVTFRPYDWVSFEMVTDYNMMSGNIDTNNLDLVLTYKDKFSILLGHRYIKERQDIEASNQVVVNGDYTINSRWRIGGYARAELSSGQLQEWEVRLTRDLSCGWFMDFGYNVRNSDIEQNNSALFIRFTLVPLGFHYRAGPMASFSDPRIGDRVAGGNSGHFTQNAVGQWRTQEYSKLPYQ